MRSLYFRSTERARAHPGSEDYLLFHIAHLATTLSFLSIARALELCTFATQVTHTRAAQKLLAATAGAVWRNSQLMATRPASSPSVCRKRSQYRAIVPPVTTYPSPARPPPAHKVCSCAYRRVPAESAKISLYIYCPSSEPHARTRRLWIAFIAIGIYLHVLCPTYRVSSASLFALSSRHIALD